MKQEKNYTETFLEKIKNKKIIAIIIVSAIIILAIITFLEKTINFCEFIYKKINHKESIEFSKLDFIREKYNIDTLRKTHLIHCFVSRREFIMHFYIPYNWDNEEPLDGPAGLRYKTYFLPNNPSVVINTSINITCLKGLIEEEDSLGIQGYKKLIDIEEDSPDIGFCELEDYVNYEIKCASKEVENFSLLSYNTSNKICIEKNSYENYDEEIIFDKEAEYYEIEGIRIKYSFVMDTTKYIVMKTISYMNDVAFTMYLGAPEKDYLKFENLFIEISNNCFIEKE